MRPSYPYSGDSYTGIYIDSAPEVLLFQGYQLSDNCRQTSNIRRTLVGNKIVDHSDVVGASPFSALLQLHVHSRLNTYR